MEININNIGFRRPKLFELGHETDTIHKVTLSLVFACLMGLLAQVRIYLPWTPVPVTGQTFAVFLASGVLGKTWGGASTTIYVGLGVAGVPWFSGWTGGFIHLTGATGGYLLGFVLAALFIGYTVDRYPLPRNFTGMLLFMLFANFVIIYGLGLVHLYLWFYMIDGSTIGLWDLLLMGAVPFVAGDMIKIVSSSAIANWLTPKHSLS